MMSLINMDGWVQALSTSHSATQVSLIVNLLLPTLLYGGPALLAFMVIRRIVRHVARVQQPPTGIGG